MRRITQGITSQQCCRGSVRQIFRSLQNVFGQKKITKIQTIKLQHDYNICDNLKACHFYLSWITHISLCGKKMLLLKNVFTRSNGSLGWGWRVWASFRFRGFYKTFDSFFHFLPVQQYYVTWASECVCHTTLPPLFLLLLFIRLLLPFYLRAWNYHDLWIHTNE